jgi:hypothetical protein
VDGGICDDKPSTLRQRSNSVAEDIKRRNPFDGLQCS